MPPIRVTVRFQPVSGVSDPVIGIVMELMQTNIWDSNNYSPCSILDGSHENKRVGVSSQFTLQPEVPTLK